MSQNNSKWYRPEIDGLRALAVLPVVLFHGGFQSFAGGFVGVDVFFVISGYLITTILLREMRSGSFSFRRFYERRARRILPALSVMMLLIIPMAWFTLTPLQFYNFAQAIGATTLFSANILYWRESGYFEEEAEANPLLHTWSLAIEEQFYLLFPVVLLVVVTLAKRAGRSDRSAVLAALGAIAAASYIWMEWWLQRDPVGNFFLAPGRIWELIVGSFCAVVMLDFTLRRSSALSAVGLAAILWAVFTFDEGTAFPSAAALLPVLGTALIILFADGTTVTGKLLSLKPLVWIGLISYSTYLWHQPLFVFARLGRQHATTPIQIMGLALLSLLLGYLSYRFVEQPFRKPKGSVLGSQGRIFMLAGASIIGFVALSALGQITDGLPQRFNLSADQQSYIETSNSISPVRGSCQSRVGGANARSYDDACVLGNEQVAPRTAILGDSHTVSLSWELGVELEARGESVRMLAHAGCGPFDDVSRAGSLRESCISWSAAMYDSIRADQSVDTVVLAYKMMFHLAGTNRANYPQLPPKRDAEVVESMKANIVRMVNGIAASGKDVIVVMQTPETPRRIRPTVYKFMSDDHSRIEGVPRAWWQQRSALAVETAQAFDPAVRILDPADLFCDGTTCYAGREGVAWYRDDNHLSLFGANIVVQEILALMNLSPITDA